MALLWQCAVCSIVVCSDDNLLRNCADLQLGIESLIPRVTVTGARTRVSKPPLAARGLSYGSSYLLSPVNRDTTHSELVYFGRMCNSYLGRLSTGGDTPASNANEAQEICRI